MLEYPLLPYPFSLEETLMNRQSARQLASFFGWAFLVCVALQLFALGMLLGLHDLAYSVHSKLFTITAEHFDLATYSFLGLMKMLGLTLFFVPWAALKITAGRFPE